jgi:hypothetical protein
MLTATQISDDGVERNEAQHRSHAKSDQLLFDAYSRAVIGGC